MFNTDVKLRHATNIPLRTGRMKDFRTLSPRPKTGHAPGTSTPELLHSVVTNGWSSIMNGKTRPVIPTGKGKYVLLNSHPEYPISMATVSAATGGVVNGTRTDIQTLSDRGILPSSEVVKDILDLVGPQIRGM